MNKILIKTYLFPIALMTCLFSSVTLAQGLSLTPDTGPQILELNWLNQNFLEKQRTLADEITRNVYGQRVRSADKGEDTRSNLKTIQRLINEEKLPGDATNDWQALGVVVGDAFVAEMEELNWKVYEDEQGKSHAVCYDNTKECIFPITMISRRVRVGSKPDIDKIFNNVLNDMKTLKPRLPYSVK